MQIFAEENSPLNNLISSMTFQFFSSENFFYASQKLCQPQKLGWVKIVNYF